MDVVVQKPSPKQETRKSHRINISDYGYDKNIIDKARKSVDILLKNNTIPEVEEEIIDVKSKEPLNLVWGGLITQNERDDLQSNKSSSKKNIFGGGRKSKISSDSGSDRKKRSFLPSKSLNRIERETSQKKSKKLDISAFNYDNKTLEKARKSATDIKNLRSLSPNNN